MERSRLADVVSASAAVAHSVCAVRNAVYSSVLVEPVCPVIRDVFTALYDGATSLNRAHLGCTGSVLPFWENASDIFSLLLEEREFH